MKRILILLILLVCHKEIKALEDPLVELEDLSKRKTLLVPASVLSAMKILKDRIEIVTADGNVMTSFTSSMLLNGRTTAIVKSSSCATDISASCQLNVKFPVTQYYFVWTKHSDKTLVGTTVGDSDSSNVDLFEYLDLRNAKKQFKQIPKAYAPQLTCTNFNWLGRSPKDLKIDELTFEASLQNPETKVDENAVQDSMISVGTEYNNKDTLMFANYIAAPKDFRGITSSPLQGWSYRDGQRSCDASVEIDFDKIVKQTQMSRVPQLKIKKMNKFQISQFLQFKRYYNIDPKLVELLSTLEQLKLIAKEQYFENNMYMTKIKWVKK